MDTISNTEVRSFSSYTKGLHAISSISLEEQVAKLTLQLPLSLQSELEECTKKFDCPALSLDGVFARITLVKPGSKAAETLEVVAEVAKKRFSNSTLQDLTVGDKVNVGMPSKSPNKWLLNSSPIGIVKLNSSGIAKGHTYTKELTFECSEDVFKCIKDLQYIGLNASGLFIREPQCLEGRYYFSIHAGRETREKTLLGQDLPIGKKFTLTLPFQPVDR